MEEEKTLKSIAPVSLALMMGIITAIIALIIGLIYAGVFATVMSSLSSLPTVSTFPLSTAFGGIVAILIPVITTVAGFIGGFIQGLLIAALYNFLAPRIGGVKVRVE